MNKDTLLLVLSAAMLIVVTGLLILFSSGVLPFSMAGPVVFLLYVLAGVFVSISCFGILTSFGEISGQPYGMNVRLGGAIVGLVVVVGGGGIYEFVVRPNDNSKLQIVFFEGSRNNVPALDAEVTLIIDATTQTVSTSGRGIVVIDNLPAAWTGRRAALLLDAPQYSTKESEIEVLISNQSVYVELVEKPIFSKYEDSNLQISVDQAFSENMASGQKTLTVHASVVSESERNVPIRSTGEIVLTKEGLEARRISSNVNADGAADFITLRPRTPKIVVFDALLPEDWELLASTAPDAILRLYYYDFERANQSDFFESRIFPFGPEFVDGLDN